MLGALDVLTYGLTFIGEGSPWHHNPTAMVEAMTEEVAAAAARVVAIAAEHVELG